MEKIKTGHFVGIIGVGNPREQIVDLILERTGAVITDTHVVYTSGKHGDAYINKDVIYPHTQMLSQLCRYIAELFEEEIIDAVIGPVVGGVALSQWVAHHLTMMHGKQIFALCADKVENPLSSSMSMQLKEIYSIAQEKHKMSLTLNQENFFTEVMQKFIIHNSEETTFTIKRDQDKFIVGGKRVLVVEDVLTTGDSVKKVIKAVESLGGVVVGVGVLCNRGGVIAEQIGHVPQLESLINITLNAYDELECPLCKEGIPINTKVGKGADFLKNKAHQ